MGSARGVVEKSEEIHRNYGMLRDRTPLGGNNKSLTVYGDYDTFFHVIITYAGTSSGLYGRARANESNPDGIGAIPGDWT
jgi:hypothetical protein